MNKLNSEIDLNKITLILFNSRKLIIINALVLTILFVLSFFWSHPLYHSQALIKIGTTNSYNHIESKYEIIEELEQKFPRIKVKIFDDDHDHIEVLSSSYSKTLAQRYIEKPIHFLLEKHKSIIDIDDNEIELILFTQLQNNPIYARHGSNSRKTKLISDIIVTQEKRNFLKEILLVYFGGIFISIFYVLIRDFSLYDSQKK
jgi:hypothetical protein